MISANKSASATVRNLVSSSGKNLTRIVKTGSAKETLSALTTQVSLARQLVESKIKLHALEKKISEVIARARGQFPK